MKVPQTPPFLEADLAGDGLSRALAEVGGLLPQTPPDDYAHWDKIRRRPLPRGFANHGAYWKCLKIKRMNGRITLPLTGKDGKPLSFVLPDEAQRELIGIDSNLRTFSDLSEPPSAGLHNRWLAKSMIEDEAIHSSLLEGAATTRAAAKKMLREKRHPRGHGERMVLNNYHAMAFARDNKNKPLSEDMIRKLHRIVTDDTLKDAADAGRFRDKDDSKFGIWDVPRGRMLYAPPKVGELPARMRALCEFANAPHESSPFVHPVVRAILLHFQIGHDHPFMDGNGRTARALFYWLMLRNGYWLAEYVSISGIVLRAPAKYARAYLHTETDDGDLTYFILHQLQTITRAVKTLRDYLDSRERAIKNARLMLKKIGDANPRQLMLLEYMVKHAHRGYTVSEHHAYHGVTLRTARTDLQELVRMGYLEMRKQGKVHVFYPTDKLMSL